MKIINSIKLLGGIVYWAGTAAVALWLVLVVCNAQHLLRTRQARGFSNAMALSVRAPVFK